MHDIVTVKSIIKQFEVTEFRIKRIKGQQGLNLNVQSKVKH